MKPENLMIDALQGPFNNLYSTLARASKIADIIAGKKQYKADVASGKVTDWTQLYGEAITIRVLCYFNLVKHYGDVPYGYENTYVDDYSLTSRFDIYDNLIASLKKVEPLMYKIGEGNITAERLSRTFAKCADRRVTVTGSNGNGNEAMLSFKPGSKLDGGISLNKWDENRMNPPYSASSRQSGINYPVLRMADVILMLAEVKAELGESGEAIALVNQIRERAFGNSSYNISGLSGDALSEAILQEKKLEFVGEGIRRWDLI